MASNPVRATIEDLLRYAVASAAALAVDVGLLTLLVSHARLPYLPASALSFTAGAVLLYLVCVKFVFRYRRVPTPVLELPLFVALGLVGLAVNCLVMYLGVSQLHENYLLAKALAATFTFGTNFALRRVGMFSRAARPHSPLALAD
jgi:putative flippase GtrA